MAVGSGLGASFGLSAETTYGTYVAPARFLEFTKETLKKNKATVQGGGLAAGRFAQLGSRRVVATTDGSGSVDMDVPDKGFGLLLQHLMGGTAAPVQQGGTTAYLQTHALTDNVGRFLTAQVGVPDTTGTVRPYSFLGGKIASAEFSCKVSDMLKASLDFDFQAVSEAQSLAAVSYSAGMAPFHFGQMAVKIGTYGSEASVSGVTGVTVKVDRGMKTDRYYAGSSGVKAEPLTNDYVKVTGSIDADFLDKTVFADRFAADSSYSLIIEWVGPLIQSTYYRTLRLRLPMCFFDGDTPGVDGPDVISGSFPFVVQSDGTNAVITAEYQSTDTTV